MVRPASFNKNGIKSGVWSKEEDDTLRKFVHKHGHRNWQKLPIFAGLARSGKSCRLRWVNYLQPGLKKDQFSKEEVDLIIKLHNQFGNRWSAIAEKLPGRTDNDVKNQWHAHIKKRGSRKVVTRAEMGHDQEQSFDTIKSTAEKTNVEVYDFSTDILPPFVEEESNAFGLCNSSTFSNSSNSGITYDYLDLPPFLEEELSDVGVCYNHTPTFSDSSIMYDDQRYLSCLPPLISEEEFSTFRLCHNDTSTFPDLSDGFSQLLPPLIPEEELFSTFGLCHNDTPTSFSDSLDGIIRQLNIDLLDINQTVESLNMNHLDVHWWL